MSVTLSKRVILHNDIQEKLRDISLALIKCNTIYKWNDLQVREGFISVKGEKILSEIRVPNSRTLIEIFEPVMYK